MRQIAAAAGVHHALVHRYFGTKQDMVRHILVAEAQAIGGFARPDTDGADSLAAFREALVYVLTEGRTSLVLMMRAELDGMRPDRMLVDSARPLALLADWLERPGMKRSADDARVMAVILGAAIMGLATVAPLLSAGAGLGDDDPDGVLSQCIDALTRMFAGPLSQLETMPAQ